MFKKINVGIAITAALFQLQAGAAQGQLASAPVRATSTAASSAYDGVVEAVRQTAIASQVAGAVVSLTVQAGDSVRAGQVLVRLDARAAAQNTAASQAQVQAARAALDVASREVERQRKLYEKKYISQSALERAEAQFRATSAQVRVDLPAGLKSLAPGMFARVWLATSAATDGAAAKTGRLFVPATAVVRRAEMTGLYVLDAKGRPLLRQVRLGRTTNGAVEVLSGLAAGERVALNPQAAAKGRP